MSPTWRRRAAWCLLVACLIGWPVSATTFARGEPPAILALSWLALILTSLDLTQTADVRSRQEGEEQE